MHLIANFDQIGEVPFFPLWDFLPSLCEIKVTPTSDCRKDAHAPKVRKIQRFNPEMVRRKPMLVQFFVSQSKFCCDTCSFSTSF
jgi:hypothetical protein